MLSLHLYLKYNHLMNTIIMADEKNCISLKTTWYKETIVGHDKKEWTEYSQLIAVVMSKRMTELGLTQQMLAEKMNCTQQYISKVLKGKKNMSLGTICKIENALNIEIIRSLNENM